MCPLRCLHWSRWSALLLSVLVGAAGCAAEVEDESVGVVSEALSGGLRVTVAEQETLGLVLTGSCSAVAISSRDVLSASHCGVQKAVSFLGRDYNVRAVVRHPQYPAQQFNDIAWLHLATPLLNRAGTEWQPSRSLFNGEGSNAVGLQLKCYGAGPDFAWRTATFTGKRINSDGFLELENTSDIDVSPGDSGGPCFQRDGQGLLVSVTKATGVPGNNLGGAVTVLRSQLRSDIASWQQTYSEDPYHPSFKYWQGSMRMKLEASLDPCGELVFENLRLRSVPTTGPEVYNFGITNILEGTGYKGVYYNECTGIQYNWNIRLDRWEYITSFGTDGVDWELYADPLRKDVHRVFLYFTDNAGRKYALDTSISFDTHDTSQLDGDVNFYWNAVSGPWEKHDPEWTNMTLQ